jgi:heptosyltransferase-2
MIALKKKPRILLVRPDKIGDVVLTTPAAAAVRERYPDAFIAFLCRDYAAPVLENNPAIDEIIRCDSPGESVLDLSRTLRKHSFDAAVHFYLDGRCELASFAAGIPERIGPFSKISALFLNTRIRQNRSQVERHEAQYNLELGGAIGAGEAARPAQMFLTETERERGLKILRELTSKPDLNPVCIHPGSAGSVQNWPLSHFFELGKQLAQAGIPVVFTAGKGEERIAEEASKIKSDGVSVIPAGSLSLRDLAAVLSQARLVVSNSTGPLHMASALGVRTLSFYPHLPKVTSARRWGPFGDPARSKILSPEKETGPMSSISPQAAFEAVEPWIA